MKRTIYYKDFSQDVIENENQNYKLPDDYVWIHESVGFKIVSAIAYRIAWLFGWVYCTLFLRIKIKNKKLLKKCKGSGFFIYANHTQLIGDVFIPACVCGKTRIFTVVSPANLGLKGIGKILPYIGALPIPEGFHEMRRFMSAVKTRIEQGRCVVIYPEAHVWPYYTGIRPFPDTSFYFPTVKRTPVLAMTVTYQKSKFFKHPKTTVFVDGPFLPDSDLCKKEQQKKLQNQVYETMTKRSENSTYQYIDYRKEEQ